MQCKIAQYLDSSDAYGNTTCATFNETKEDFDEKFYELNARQITKYFNPTTLLKEKKLNYMS